VVWREVCCSVLHWVVALAEVTVELWGAGEAEVMAEAEGTEVVEANELEWYLLYLLGPLFQCRSIAFSSVSLTPRTLSSTLHST
jgi:hypothetical protein